VSEPANGFGYRLNSLERRLDRIEQLEPAVMRAQLQDVKDDIHELAREIGYIRKVLTGFLVTFAFTGITIVISLVVLTRGGA
jgi:hypothetical protein